MAEKQSDKERIIGILANKREYLDYWLEGHQSAQTAVPHVQANRELTEWQLQALENAPDEAGEIPLRGLVREAERDYDNLRAVLPPQPVIDVARVANTTSVSTSGSSGIYEYVTRVGDIGTPNCTEYSTLYAAQYHQLQAAQHREEEVRQMLWKYGSPSTQDRFDSAATSYASVKAGAGNRRAAALDLRNLLDGVKGDLLRRAQRRSKENMTWEKMISRLGQGALGSTERDLLLQMKTERSRLISRLSDVIKDRESGAATNLEAIWTQVLDHLYTVLTLTKPTGT